jgi:LPPG:FO 2-phospho-L-lactate transferase
MLGGESWFRIGDRDLGLHLVRTEALRRGEPLSRVTARLARSFGVEVALLPATDDRLQTWVTTPNGPFQFQEWFVARGHRDPVEDVRYEGAEEARAGPGVLEALEAADVIVLAPSNPFVSIGPILAVGEIRRALEERRVPAVAISPLIGGKAIKGPADAMLARLAAGTRAEHVARVYRSLIDVLVLDESDAGDAEAVSDFGIRPVTAETLMVDGSARRRLAERVLRLAAAYA